MLRGVINTLGCPVSPTGTAAPTSALLWGDFVQAEGISVKHCHRARSHLLPFPTHCPTSQTPFLSWAQVINHTSAELALEMVFHVSHVVFQAVGYLTQSRAGLPRHLCWHGGCEGLGMSSWERGTRLRLQEARMDYGSLTRSSKSSAPRRLSGCRSGSREVVGDFSCISGLCFQS